MCVCVCYLFTYLQSIEHFLYYLFRLCGTFDSWKCFTLCIILFCHYFGGMSRESNNEKNGIFVSYECDLGTENIKRFASMQSRRTEEMFSSKIRQTFVSRREAIRVSSTCAQSIQRLRSHSPSKYVCLIFRPRCIVTSSVSVWMCFYQGFIQKFSSITRTYVR